MYRRWALFAGIAAMVTAAGCFDAGAVATHDAFEAREATDKPAECLGLPECTGDNRICWWGVECCFYDNASAEWKHVTMINECLFDVPSEGAVDTADVPDVAVDADTPVDVHDVPPDVPPDAFDVPADVGPLPERLVLDPASLTFFGLPIDSSRGAVAGHDAAARTCVSVIFDFSNTGHAEGAWCDEFAPMFPYVILERDTDGPCGAWAYGGGPEVTGLAGCVDFGGFLGHGIDLADFEVTVVNPGGGTTVIEARNRATYTPTPVSLGLRYMTDIPEDVFIQTGDDYGLPSWAQVLGADGVPRLLFDRCDVPSCDAPGGGVCGIAFHQVRNVTGGTYQGQAWLTWDGRFRVLDEAGDCWKAEPAPAGAYTLRTCFGWSTDSSGGIGPDVKDPVCRDVAFTLPDDTKVAVVADFGG